MPETEKTVGVPLGVCWNITGRCNGSCRFCYRSTARELPLDTNLTILRDLVRAGVRKISWAGGEPTMYPGLVPLVEEAKDRGVTTSITSNATPLATAFLKSYHHLFDWITLPLDSLSAGIQRSLGRPADHVDQVLSLLEFLSRTEAAKLKINTVFTAMNTAAINGIPTKIAGFGVTRWKLFRFLPSRGNARRNRLHFEVDDSAFAHGCDDLKRICEGFPALRLTFVDTCDYEDAHLSVEPNGEVQKYVAGSYRRCGNLVTDGLAGVLSDAAVSSLAIARRYERVPGLLGTSIEV